jgi:Ca2+-binding RTX toxin-like protein
VTGAVEGVLSVQGGEGNDTVDLQDSPTGTVVLEFGAGDDTLIVGAGKDYSGANLTLTGLETIQLGATGTATFAGSQLTGQSYAVKGTNGSTDTITVKAETGTADENIDLSGLTVTDSVTTGLKGAIITGNDGENVLSGTSRNDAITGGKGDDTINLSAGGNDTVKFSAVANNGNDTIIGFNAGTDAASKDVLEVSNLTTLTKGADAQTDLLLASSASKVSLASADFLTGQANADSNGVIIIKDQAAADWSDVASVIENALTVDGTAANNGEFVIMVDNGTDSRAYAYKDVADGFDAGDITLVGTVSDVQSYTTQAVFDVSNFA